MTVIRARFSKYWKRNGINRGFRIAAQRQGFYLRPHVNLEAATRYAAELFGLKLSQGCQPKELCSYNDRNFLVEGKLRDAKESSMFVLKVMNSLETHNPGFIDTMDAAMLHFGARNKELLCPQPIKSLSGLYRRLVRVEVIDPIKSLAAYYRCDKELTMAEVKEIAINDPFAQIKDSNGTELYYMKHYVRLLSFVPGKTLSEVDHMSKDLLWNCGVMVAKVQNTLRDFKLPLKRSQNAIWPLHKLPTLRKPYLLSVRDLDRQALAAKIIKEFEDVPGLQNFPLQVLHGDLHDWNIICRPLEDGEYNGDTNHIQEGITCNNAELSMPRASKYKIEGIIDFGEIIWSYRVIDIAICIAYLCLKWPNDIETVTKTMFAGYSSLVKLQRSEIEALPTFVKARITQSLIIGSHHSQKDPGNDYVAGSNKIGWEVLMKLEQIPREKYIEELLSIVW